MSDDEERSQIVDAPIEIELDDTTPQTEPDVTPHTPVTPEEPVKTRTPLPKGAILAACLVFSCEAFQYTFVFPFLAFMYAIILFSLLGLSILVLSNTKKMLVTMQAYWRVVTQLHNLYLVFSLVPLPTSTLNVLLLL